MWKASSKTKSHGNSLATGSWAVYILHNNIIVSSLYEIYNYNYCICWSISCSYKTDFLQSFLGGMTYILNVCFFFLEYKRLVGIATVYRVFICQSMCSRMAFFSHLNRKHQLGLMAKQFSDTVAFKLSVIEFAKKLKIDRQVGSLVWTRS